MIPLELMNTPWKLGGGTTAGIDCWGVVRYVYTAAGEEPPSLPQIALDFDKRGKLLAGREANPDWVDVADARLAELDIVVWYPDDVGVAVAVCVDAIAGLLLTSIEGVGVRTFRRNLIPGELVGTYRKAVPA